MVTMEDRGGGMLWLQAEVLACVPGARGGGLWQVWALCPTLAGGASPGVGQPTEW